MIKKEKNSVLKVEIRNQDLEKICYWTALKYKNDNFHYQNVGNKNEYIGCFFDHWIQKLPETLVFEKLLENKEFGVVEDNFIYGQDTKKNSPDIIGLKKDGKTYPMALYNAGNWEMEENSVFVEMKTVKNNHDLLIIPKTQFDREKYYAVVKSNLKEDYLLNLFDDSFFNEENLNNLKTPDEFVKSNEKLILPEKLKKSDKIGFYELLGIFKGKDFEEIMIESEKGNHRYLKSIEKVDSNLGNNMKTLNNGLYFHLNNDEKNIPIMIEYESESEITLINEKKTFIEVEIKGIVKIDNYELKNGIYRLNYNTFNKSSNKKEYLISMNILEGFKESRHEELIKKLENFIEMN